MCLFFFFFFFQAEDGIRDWSVTGVQTCALPICAERDSRARGGGDDHADRNARDGVRTRNRESRLLPRRRRDPRAGTAGRGALRAAGGADAPVSAADHRRGTPLAVGPDNVVHLGEAAEGWFAAE